MHKGIGIGKQLFGYNLKIKRSIIYKKGSKSLPRLNQVPVCLV